MSSFRKAINSVAHKRAREVARKKRIQSSGIKEGKVLPAEFRTNRTRQ